MSARILVLPGTARFGTPDHALAFEAARLLAQTSASVEMLSLADYPLPILDTDAGTLEELPEAALRLAGRVETLDALLLVSPDANSSVPPLPKNAIDWTARVRRLDGRLVSPFRGLVVGLASASPGRGGGFRALDAWRTVFLSLGAEVIGAQATVSGGAEAFDATGRLRDGDAAEMLAAFVANLVEKAQALGRRF